jgi:hypothetical protein
VSSANICSFWHWQLIDLWPPCFRFGEWEKMSKDLNKYLKVHMWTAYPNHRQFLINTLFAIWIA